MAINSIIEELKVSREKAVSELQAVDQHQIVLKSVVDRLDALIGDASNSNGVKRVAGLSKKGAKRRGRKPGVKSRTVKRTGPTLTQAAVDVVLAGEGDVSTRQVIDKLVTEKQLDGENRSVAYAKVHTALKRRSTGEGAPLKSAGKGLWVKA